MLISNGGVTATVVGADLVEGGRENDVPKPTRNSIIDRTETNFIAREIEVDLVSF